MGYDMIGYQFSWLLPRCIAKIHENPHGYEWLLQKLPPDGYIFVVPSTKIQLSYRPAVAHRGLLVHMPTKGEGNGRAQRHIECQALSIRRLDEVHGEVNQATKNREKRGGNW